MRARTIRQHYVPEFYLRNFSNMSKGICAQAIDGREQKTVSISSIAQEKKYYDVEFLSRNLTDMGENVFAEEEDYVFKDKDMLVLSLEKWFKLNEDRVAPIIDRIIKYPFYNPLKNEEEKKDLALFISMLLVRGPNSKKIFEKKIEINSLKRSLDKYFKDTIGDEMEKKLLWMHTFSHCVSSFAEKLYFCKDWSLVYVASDVSFITTDNPLLLHLPKPFSCCISNIGIMTPMVQILLPLGRKCLLLINHSQYEYYGHNVPDKYIISKSRALELNELQRKQAICWIFP